MSIPKRTAGPGVAPGCDHRYLFSIAIIYSTREGPTSKFYINFNPMKQLKTILLFAIIALNSQAILGQEIRELEFKALDPEFIELKKTLKEINETDDQKSIELSLEALDKFTDANIRFDLLVWELSVHYAKLKQYNKCFEILKQGQQEGMFYYIRSGDRPFPAYTPELEKLDG